jgi:RNA polymerase primary sigma factor
MKKMKQRKATLAETGKTDWVDFDVPYAEASGIENAAATYEFEPGENSLGFYLAEIRETPLLRAQDERLLGSRIEKGKHIAFIEQSWASEHNAPPSAVDLLLMLLERLSQAEWLFEALCRHLELTTDKSLAEKITCPELRRAIDGHIDESLSASIATLTGKTRSEVEQSLIQFSLDSSLVPWDILEIGKQVSSLSDLGTAIHSRSFRQELEENSFRIAQHFQDIKAQAQQATDHMIRANLRLVISVARDNINRGVPLADLIQEGNIGLMQAVQKFDFRKGYKFSTYAIPWIWQAINRAANDQARIIRLPGHLVEAVTKLFRARNTLFQKLGRQPTAEELAAEMGLPSHKVEWLLEVSSGKPISFETPIGDEGDELGDFVSDRTLVEPEEEADTALLKEQVSEVLQSLTPRERRIIELRFGLGEERYGHTLEEVGTELGLTKERIRQIEKEALAKLRHPVRSRKLLEFL